MISNKQHNTNSTLHNGSCITQYLFNGKELDQETGYYYYGARYYDPSSTLFLGVDPLYEQKPNVSPYLYCLANPLKYIDPDGRDEFDVNCQGEVFNRIENKNVDSFHIVDDNGQRMDGQSIEFTYGTVQDKRSETVKTEEGESVPIDIYEITDMNSLDQLFNFVQTNTDVEWSETVGEENNIDKNYLTTGHQRNTEWGVVGLIVISPNLVMCNYTHGHPGNTPYPSKKGDIPFKNYMIDRGRATDAIFNIFLPGCGRYISY